MGLSWPVHMNVHRMDYLDPVLAFFDLILPCKVCAKNAKTTEI
ncbi:MAG: hypothetical protein WCT54_03370 [Patescibacteria group bacterium]